MEFERGQIVFSKCGRDKGLPFIILNKEGEFLYLADGKYRLIEKPKKKKIIHVQGTKLIDLAIKKSLENGEGLLDSDIRKSIATSGLKSV